MGTFAEPLAWIWLVAPRVCDRRGNKEGSVDGCRDVDGDEVTERLTLPVECAVVVDGV